MKRIDVHHHAFPEPYFRALNEAGVIQSMGVDIPQWTPEISLKQMDKNEIRTAILSISAPGVYFPDFELPEGFSVNLARIANESLANAKRQYPDRFGGFATLPLLDDERAIEELDYALDHLSLDGVCLLSNYQGTYLGDPVLEPIFAELHRRKAVVLVHPTEPGPLVDPGLEIPIALIEAPFDTTRAVANMMFNGVLDRYPGITFILSHGGGTIPFLAWRMAGIEYAQHDRPVSVTRALYDYLLKARPEKGLRNLRRMYFDTALVSGSYALRAMLDFAGAEQLVFGSDLCIAKLSQIVAKNLKKDGGFSESEYEAISYKNSLKLFPQFNESATDLYSKSA